MLTNKEEEEKLIQELLRCWSDGSVECRVGPFPHGIIPFIKITGKMLASDQEAETEVSGDGGMEDIDA